MNHWNIYYKKHINREVRSQLIKAVSYCINKNNALDLGSGTLIESKFLIQNGFKHVTAVDSSLETEKFKDGSKNLDLIIKPFKQYKFSFNTFDLINAQFSLPFYGKENFDYFINKIIYSLKPGGIFTGQFFGIKDSWNTQNSNLVFHTKEEILNLFHELKILELIEEEKDDSSVNNPLKHWHIFNFIVKK